jgi:formamidopyrimidine-DNA glycosylase
MPELPEIECLTRDLKEKLENCVFGSITFNRLDLRWTIPDDKIIQYVSYQKILKVFRRSKYIVVAVPRGYLIVHLGMSGNILLSKTQTPIKPHTHVIFEILNGMRLTGYLHFIDPRRFGSISFCDVPNLGEFPLFKWLGPDPLHSQDITRILIEKSRRTKISIKTFIMNAKNIVGVGNIYANEALFMANIHPFQLASQLSESEWQKLSEAIKKVLLEAIAAGGTSFKDYRTLQGVAGNYKEKLLVYDREGLACIYCETKIVATRHQSRSTYFCPQCQQN